MSGRFVHSLLRRMYIAESYTEFQKMNILAHIHAYPPFHNAGAEWMLHTMLRGLVGLGCNARVLTHIVSKIQDKPRHSSKPKRYEFEGVEVYDIGADTNEAYGKSDIVITHLEKGNDSMHGAPSYAKKHNLPLCRLVHNSVELFTFNANKDNTDLLIFNSHWIRDHYNKSLSKGWDQIVFRPPIDLEYYTTESDQREYITLINLNDNKGAKQFYDIALQMPNCKFLGVKGSYDHQMIRNLPNVKILENTSDIKSVYKVTKILLVPSAIETFGRVAVEAMCSGIPVIVNPTDGLNEACGEAAIYCDRNDIKSWVEAIKGLENVDNYKKYSNLAYIRAGELKPDYAALKSSLIDTINKFKSKKKEDMKHFNSGNRVYNGETVEVTAKRNFRHKDIAYEKGQVNVPVGDVDFLVNRGLIVPMKEQAKRGRPAKNTDIDDTTDKKEEKKEAETKEEKGGYFSKTSLLS